MSRERWRQIGDWPYEVSTLGKLRRTETACGTRAGLVLRDHNATGYRRVFLHDSPRSQHFFVHRLVAETFLGPPTDKWRVVNHKNGDKCDNRLVNLEWCTREENQLHAATLHNHKGEGHGNAKLTLEEVRQIRKQYNGEWGQQTKLAKEYGVTQMLVSKIVRGEVWDDAGGKLLRSGKKQDGQDHGMAKLTNRQVRAIRRRFAVGTATLQQLATQYGVGRQIIRDIAYGKTWKHVT